jgi:hypothetical protein
MAGRAISRPRSRPRSADGVICKSVTSPPVSRTRRAARGQIAAAIAQVYLAGDRMPNQSWKSKFDEPIVLPDGRKLRSLKDAIAWLAKEIPNSEHTMPKVQTAARMVTEAAENNGPMIFARMGVMQAVHRHDVQEFGTSSRKPHHWGKRKLKRDE